MMTSREMKDRAARMFEIHEEILDHMTFHSMSEERLMEWDILQADIYDAACRLMDEALDIDEGMRDDYLEEQFRYRNE
jgi:hypothetical protein